MSEMPKHIIEFQIPEEKAELEITLQAPGMHSVIHDLDNWLRDKIKHGEMTQDARGVFEDVRTELHRILEDNGVNLF